MNKIIIEKVNGKYEIRRKDDEVERLKMLTIDSDRETAERSTNGVFNRNIINDDVNCCSSEGLHVSNGLMDVDHEVTEDDVPELRPEWLHLLEASIDLRRCPLCEDIVIRELYFQHLKKKHPNTNAMSNVGNKLVKKARIVNTKRDDHHKILFGMEKCKRMAMSRLKNKKVNVIRNLVCTSNAVETNNCVPSAEKTSLKISEKLHREFVIKHPGNVDSLPGNIILSVSETVNNFTENHTLKVLSNIPKKPLLFEYSANKNCNGLSNDGNQSQLNENLNFPNRVTVVSDIVLNMFSPREYRHLWAGVALSPPPSPFLAQPPIFPPLPTSPPPLDTSVYHSEQPPPPPTSPPSSPPEPQLPASSPPTDILVYQDELLPTSAPSPPESPPTDTLVFEIELQSTSSSSFAEQPFTDTLINQSELPPTSALSPTEPTLPTSTSPSQDNQITLYRQPSLFENRLVAENQSNEICDNILPVCHNVREQKYTLDPRLAYFGNIERIYTRSDEFEDISGNEDENDDLKPQQYSQQQLFTPTYENISDDDEDNNADRHDSAFSDLSIAFSTNKRGENFLNVSYVKNNDKKLVRISFQYDKADLDNFTRKEILSNVRNYILSNICSLDIVDISEPKIIENVVRPEPEIKFGDLTMTETFSNTHTLPGNETDDSISSGSFESVDKLPESDRQSVNEREEPLFFNGFESNIDLNNTSDLLAAVTEIETNFVQEGSRVQENVLDFVRNSVLDERECSYATDKDDTVINIISSDDEDDCDQNTTSQQHYQPNQKNLTEETTTSNNNTSNESGGVTVSPQAIEKVLEMLTSIYQQTSRLTSLSPTQSQCGVCHHYQDSSHVAKLQEICESIKIDPKLMMAPPNHATSTETTPELPITIVDDDDDVVILDSNSNQIQKRSDRKRNFTKTDDCVIVQTVPLQPRPGRSKRPRQVKVNKNEPKPKLPKSNNIPYVHRGCDNSSDDDIILIEDPSKPSTSKMTKIESLSQLKRKYKYVEPDVAESETSTNFGETDNSMQLSIDENCDTESCTINPRKKQKKIKQMFDRSLPTSTSTIGSTKSTICYVSHHSTSSATSASTAISTSAASSAESASNYYNRVRRSELFKTFLNPNNDYCTVTYNCDGSFRWITINSSAKKIPKQWTYRQLRKSFAIAEVKRKVYKSFTGVEQTDDYWIKDTCDHVDDYIYYSLRTYKTDLHDILTTCYGDIPKQLNPHLEKFLEDDLKYKHVNNSAFNRKKNGIDKKQMSAKEREEYIYSLDCDDINHYTIF